MKELKKTLDTQPTEGDGKAYQDGYTAGLKRAVEILEECGEDFLDSEYQAGEFINAIEKEIGGVE